MEGVIGHDKWGRKVTTSTPTRHERFNPRFCLSLLRNPGSDTWGSETDHPTGTNRRGGKWSSDSDSTTASSKVGILVGCQYLQRRLMRGKNYEALKNDTSMFSTSWNWTGEWPISPWHSITLRLWMTTVIASVPVESFLLAAILMQADLLLIIVQEEGENVWNS
ncbi:hypothetical protein CEXT_482791 [Caerostris extrusa]|uniref:Uncharacterized protein n=1 Tax=Caerostris extrusa TaxID=172846 RepID=A0AAV4Y6P6_CAEEX|nr:hypothetical protein CEXT_482791 [Caerostris extrusa]